MKKFLILTFIVFVLILFALAFFVFTFDANRYQSQIEKELSRAVGHQIQVGNLSLGWRGGLALEVDGLQAFSNDEPVLQIQNAGAVLQIMPLLRRSIQVASIFVDGADIRVVKNSDGALGVQGIHLAKIASKKKDDGSLESVAKPSTSAAWTSFFIERVNLANLDIHYEDDSQDFPIQLEVKNLQLAVKNVSLFKPMDFEGAAAVFGMKKNIQVSGRVKLESLAQAIVVDGLKIEADLQAMDVGILKQSFPALTKEFLVTSWGGRVELNISEFKFQNGKVNQFEADLGWKDGSLSTAEADQLVEHLQLSLNQVQLKAPFDFRLQAAVLSDTTNLSLQGRAEMGESGRVVISSTQADLDLNRLTWSRVESVLPALRGVGLAAPPEGRIHADIRRFETGRGQRPRGEADFRYDQGRVRLKGLPQDFNQIQMTGNLRGDQLSLDAWNLNFGSSPAEGRINIQNLFETPVFRAEIRARNLDLKTLTPPAQADKPQAEGTLSFEVSFGGSGKAQEAIVPSLSGTGHFRVENPVVRNLNILEEIFSKLSAIPGMRDALNQRMSDSLKERRMRRDTSFQTIDQNFSIEQGGVRFQNFEAISPDLMIRGPVTAQFNGALNARPTIWVHEEIMAELTERVHELAYALNSKGQLQIPLTVTGQAPQFNILPDLQFLLGEIVRNKAGQMAGQLAQKAAGGERTDRLSQFFGTQTAGTTPSQTSPVPSEDVSVPVKVHPDTDQKPQSLLEALTGQPATGDASKPASKTEIAAGILGSLLSAQSSEQS